MTPEAEVSDVSLGVRMIRGDRTALAALFERHGASVHALAAAVCGSESADAITVALFLRLWRNPGDFEPDRASMRGFLLASAHRHAVELARSRPSPPPSTGGERSPARRNEMARAQPAEALPRPERDAILLAYFGGRTYRQVARGLSQPEDVTRRRIRSGLLALHELMASGDSGTRAAPDEDDARARSRSAAGA
jgi:RNA polymerase sigma-70 factor (ECF subfamily)